MILDDIVLAPLALRYGANAIVSPHDCMSAMFWSHFRMAGLAPGAVKYYLQYLTARRYERSYYHYALLVHVIGHRDRVQLQALNPRARYHIIPNTDLLNPGFSKSRPDSWDVMVWGDLRISSILQGVREFLSCISAIPGWVQEHKVIVVGRVGIAQARAMIGDGLLDRVEYAPMLEGEDGSLRQAGITVIPDLGGAGMKNRVVNILALRRSTTSVPLMRLRW
jgi:hypothetical protein